MNVASAIDKARHIMGAIKNKCNCSACSQFNEADQHAAIGILAMVDIHPGICFRAIMDDMLIGDFIELINAKYLPEIAGYLKGKVQTEFTANSL